MEMFQIVRTTTALPELLWDCGGTVYSDQEYGNDVPTGTVARLGILTLDRWVESDDSLRRLAQENGGQDANWWHLLELAKRHCYLFREWYGGPIVATGATQTMAGKTGFVEWGEHGWRGRNGTFYEAAAFQPHIFETGFKPGARLLLVLPD